ncbi:MAG TPA: hypothetical protein VJI33_00950 [Candidatus Paceibacterota bacterium]
MKTAWTNQIKSGHHAYLITGTEEKTLTELVEFLEKDWKIEVKGNPDFIIQKYPTLYIDDCHKISADSSTKPIGDGDRIFIIYFGFMTRESANSLLKLFEEPIPKTIFFVITPSPERLPATLRSRFSEIKTVRESESEAKKEAEQFIKMNLGERFEYSKKLAGDVSDEKLTRSDALAILEAIEENIAKNQSVSAKTAQIFKELEKCRSYLKDQSSSVKMLFDQTAMVIAEIIK